MKKVRVRFPPSPTGNLHVGTARTMLFNWLFARKHGGEVVMRLEDTDTERSTKEFEADIIESLKWLGLDWDGEIYHQSKRAANYRKALEKLLSEKKAFWCNHSKEELEAEQKIQTENHEAPRHICDHKNKNFTEGIIRLSVDHNSDRVISFDDKIRGPIEFKESLLGDFAIARNLDSALYHFTVVVDDIDMNITHVIRGEDHISNTPKHILIYEALDTSLPVFAHMPLVLGTDKSKLSKRHGSTAVSEFSKDYLSDALINFLGFLGCTFSKDILSREEMIEEFELEKVHKSGAVFDVKKLNWINSQYVKRLSPSEFKKVANLPDLPDKAVPLITERLEKLTDVHQFSYLWVEPEYEADLLQWKGSSVESVTMSLQELFVNVEKIHWEEKTLSDCLDKLAEKLGGKGIVFWPLRVALSGQEKSPGPIEIALVVGRDKTLDRINAAIEKLKS